MNKAELVKAIAEKSGLTQVDAEKALNAFTETITHSLSKGESVALIGFGTYSVSERSARTGINPKTKEPLKIAAKKVAKFKAGSKLAEAVHPVTKKAVAPAKKAKKK